MASSLKRFWFGTNPFRWRLTVNAVDGSHRGVFFFFLVMILVPTENDKGRRSGSARLGQVRGEGDAQAAAGQHQEGGVRRRHHVLVLPRVQPPLHREHQRRLRAATKSSRLHAAAVNLKA